MPTDSSTYGTFQNISGVEDCRTEPGLTWAERNNRVCSVLWPTARAGVYLHAHTQFTYISMCTLTKILSICYDCTGMCTITHIYGVVQKCIKTRVSTYYLCIWNDFLWRICLKCKCIVLRYTYAAVILWRSTMHSNMRARRIYAYVRTLDTTSTHHTVVTLLACLACC